MISKIKQFFSDNIAGAKRDNAALEHSRARLAAAALLVEVMVIDAQTTLDEKEHIAKVSLYISW